MGAFILACVLGLFGIVVLVLGVGLRRKAHDIVEYRAADIDDVYGRAPRKQTKDSKRAQEVRNIGSGHVAVGVVMLVAAGFVVMMDSWTQVPVRTVAIELSAGKPVGTLDNGIHWVAPWHNIDKEWDGSVQTDTFLDDTKKDGCQGMAVRLGNQTTACVDVSLQWRIHPSADVIELYRDYKTFANVDNNLVHRQLQHALNVAYSNYDPLAGLTATATNISDARTAQDAALAAKTADVLRPALGGGIEIRNVTIPMTHYDPATEDRLRQYQQAIADTRIAEQRGQTAVQQRQANDNLAASVASSNPGVLYQNCLDLIRDLGTKNQLKDLPPTFNCGGAQSSPVLINPKAS
jgi:regulator of protease activity HflC (stomatin/prohibitin superfamily)